MTEIDMINNEINKLIDLQNQAYERYMKECENGYDYNSSNRGFDEYMMYETKIDELNNKKEALLKISK